MPSWLISPHPSKGKARLTSKGSLRFLQMRESHEAPWWRCPIPHRPHRSMQTPGRTPRTPPGPGRSVVSRTALFALCPPALLSSAGSFPNITRYDLYSDLLYRADFFSPLFSRKQRLYTVRAQVSVAFQRRPQASFSLNHSHVSGC